MKKRKMTVVVNQVKKEDEDQLDIEFWLSRPASERIAEVTRLRKAYYTWLLGSYPQNMEKVITKRKNVI
ncbi:hypothetical protein ACP6L2_13005 [Sphingobacterium lactis]|uniref:hypothetical protein n=1 Tax=Sphingobacterium lactis TaxID=797291 RepID=UPI003F7E61C6